MNETATVAAGLPAALRAAWVEIDLDALEHNLEAVRRRVRPAGVLAVIKADAYGHGAQVVARVLSDAGVDWLGVALVEEGVQIRRSGVDTPILVLGTTTSNQLPMFHRYGLTPAISSLAQLNAWREWAAAAGPALSVHLKVDVGMHRLGLTPEELPEALGILADEPRLELSGLLSHLAAADDLSSPRTVEQERRFAALVESLPGSDRKRIALHLANSAAALHHRSTHHSFVRVGLALFGLDPARQETDLQPVMAVRSRIMQLKRVPAGARAGYGATWTAGRETLLAVVPVGYADGYSWRLSNRAEMLVQNRRVPVVGAVSMDMTLLDVTDVAARLHDRAVLLGRQGAEEITAWELAELAGTIPYEILCHLGLRMPRRYRRGGREISWNSHLTGSRP